MKMVLPDIYTYTHNQMHQLFFSNVATQMYGWTLVLFLRQQIYVVWKRDYSVHQIVLNFNYIGSMRPA